MAAPLGILYVIDTLRRGGTELQLAGLIARLDRSRFRPRLVTLRDHEADVLPPDCPHRELGAASLASPAGLRALASLRGELRREGVTICQTFFQDATLMGGLAGAMAGTPVRLGSFRDLGFWRTRRQELVLRPLYRSLTGFVANSAAVRDHFCSHDGLDPARVTVIPNGLDTGAVAFRPPRAQPRVVGIVGNLTRPVKRIDLFVAAAGKLAKLHPEVRFEVVGDGRLRGELEAQAAALDLGDRLVFRGRCPDVPAILADWDVGVLCSDSEGFSNALLEYLLAGCAAVATDVGGNREAVDHGRTGLLVPVGDAAALADAVGRCLTDHDLRSGLVAAARADAESRFSWDACVQAHENLYERLAGPA